MWYNMAGGKNVCHVWNTNSTCEIRCNKHSFDGVTVSSQSQMDPLCVIHSVYVVSPWKNSLHSQSTLTTTMRFLPVQHSPSALFRRVWPSRNSLSLLMLQFKASPIHLIFKKSCEVFLRHGGVGCPHWGVEGGVFWKSMFVYREGGRGFGKVYVCLHGGREGYLLMST